MSSKEKYEKEIVEYAKREDVEGLYSCYLTFLGTDLEYEDPLLISFDYSHLASLFWKALLGLDKDGTFTGLFCQEFVHIDSLDLSLLTLFFEKAVEFNQVDKVRKMVWPILVRRDMMAEKGTPLLMNALLPIKEVSFLSDYLYEVFLQEGCGQNMDRILKDPSFFTLIDTLSVKDLLLLFYSLESDCLPLEKIIGERVEKIKERVTFLFADHPASHMEELTYLLNQLAQANDLLEDSFSPSQKSVQWVKK